MRKLIRNIARVYAAKEGIQRFNKCKASGCSIFAENWRKYAKNQIELQRKIAEEKAKTKEKAVELNDEHTANHEHSDCA